MRRAPWHGSMRAGSLKMPCGLTRLIESAPDIETILNSETSSRGQQEASEIQRRTVWVAMRDGTRLATDLYRPHDRPAPTIVVRTPYGRSLIADQLIALAQHGYVGIAQDCRGTGDSEPDTWDTYVYEREDSFDFVEWATHQEWFDGFIGSCGGSYLGSTQWAMAMHPLMSAIAPEVAGLVVFPTDMPRYYMLVNAYSRSVGKGNDKLPVAFPELEKQILPETLAGGFFNEPLHASLSGPLLERYSAVRDLPLEEAKRWLWEEYRRQGPAARAQLIRLALNRGAVTLESLDELTAVFGHRIPVGLYINPCSGTTELAESLRSPALVITGWYDWGLGDTLATWELLMRDAATPVRSRCRLLISPSAHNMPGYHEGRESHPELERIYRTPSVTEKTARNANMRDLLLRWYRAVREDTLGSWPMATFYLMGANEWCAASAWPPAEARMTPLYLGEGGLLTSSPPLGGSSGDTYVYDPTDPTPTLGGSIISYVYPPGSVEVNHLQRRSDVLTFTTPPLDRDLDVVGPIRLILYACSSAVDTDFAGRLSDVFPDGRAIQLQIGVMRARYRDAQGAAELLEPGRIYRFQIEMWATANRFKAGHRLRLDVCSADFPRLDRNANLGGNPGPPIRATQTVFHDAERPSHLLLSIIGNEDISK